MLIVQQACHTKQVLPPAIRHQLDSLKTLSFGVPPDSELAVQEQVTRIARQYQLTDEQIRSYCRTAYIYKWSKMDFERAKKMLDSASILMKQTGRTKMWSTINLYYSSIYFTHMDSMSQYYLEQVLPKLDELDPFDKSMALCSAGNIQKLRKNSSGALAYYARSLNEAKKIRPRNLNAEIGLYNNRALVYYYQLRDTLAALREYRRALALVTDSLEKTGENAEYIYYNLGRYYIDLKQPDSALRYIQKHAAMTKARYSGKGMPLLPNIYFAQIALLKNEYKKADTLLTAFGRFLDTSNLSDPTFAYDYIDTYYETLYKLKKAEGNMTLALKALEDQKKFSNRTIQKKENAQLAQSEQTLEKKRMEAALAEQGKKAANSRLIYSVVIFLLLLIIAASLVIFFRNKKRLEEQKLKALQQALEIEKKELLLQAETTERKRIAQEFHDELGGVVTIISMAAGALGRQQKDTADRDLADVLQRNSKKLNMQINEIVWSLNDKNDDLGSLLAYMQRYTTQFLSDAGLAGSIHFTRELVELPIEGYKRRYLFQSVKECLNNIVKHAGATEVECSAALTPGILTITIADNGKGMPIEHLTKGNGLDNIRTNIQALGGSVRWEQHAGTRVVITVPLKALAREQVA
ncbi:tetratricopeptide repeat-containing sensor histidine kinase [Niabella drilacis]|uniref:tetratricopeptide repeat-containing sensor histidine kinase n=1 Tax=Niabella drilacis (strain DSM 25811 / CCM 8410 / CCUG 62505 / LMG 26954 / E90) TaxID=1285928 RepID=UPI0015A25A20|nr:tetratricopeptide repeat-containing sensor histidine kinase [Niabella drilacis]